jgi:hypothetical protein
VGGTAIDVGLTLKSAVPATLKAIAKVAALIH